jgi:glutathione S-transferase
MKLYTYAGAPNPRRVHLYLAEKGLEIPSEKVDIMARENRDPTFLEKVNKLGGIPVLELDDGSHLAESVAICRYLEALHPDPPLFGTTAEEIGRIEMWSRRIELNLMSPVGMAWLHGSPFTKAVMPNQIAEVAEQSRGQAREFLRFLEDVLAHQDYIAGNEFTIADILALTTIDFAAGLVELPIQPELEHVLAWHERVSARPSAKEHPAVSLG